MTIAQIQTLMNRHGIPTELRMIDNVPHIFCSCMLPDPRDLVMDDLTGWKRADVLAWLGY